MHNSGNAGDAKNAMRKPSRVTWKRSWHERRDCRERVCNIGIRRLAGTPDWLSGIIRCLKIRDGPGWRSGDRVTRQPKVDAPFWPDTFPAEETQNFLYCFTCCSTPAAEHT